MSNRDAGLDTEAQRIVLANSAVARSVRKRFAPGTMVMLSEVGIVGSVTRHIPGYGAEGGWLVVRWETGLNERLRPSRVVLAPALADLLSKG